MSQNTPLYERVRMTVSGTPGTGTFTLGSAVLDALNGDYRSFAQAGVPNAASVSYLAQDGHNWEVGHGTYTVSGTTLTRSVVLSNNSNNPINASSGTIVSITALALDYVSQQPMSIVMAAHDSLASAKAAAQFVCTGTNDDVLINSTIASLTNGGTINFMSGTYNLGNTITIDLDWITLRGEGNQHWGGYITFYQGTTAQQSVTGAPGGAKFVQTNTSANGITIGTTLTQMHGTTGSGSTGDTRHKGIAIEKLYLSGPADQPLLQTVTVTGTIAGGDSGTITFTSAGLTGSPITLTIPVVGGDSTTTVAAKIGPAIAANSVLAAAGISATNVANVATITCLTSLIPLPTFSVTSGSSITFATAAGAPASYGTGTGISDKFISTSAGQKGFSDICRITECSIFGFLNGIQVGWDTGHICDNNLQNLGGWGIRLEGINTVCKGNIIFDLNGPGIYVWPFQNGNGNHIISGNVIGDVGNDTGITLLNDVTLTNFTAYNTITNNTILGAHAGCMLLGTCNNSVISNNILNKTFLQPISTGPGILLGFSAKSCNNNVIAGNIINDSGSVQSDVAIWMINSSTGNVINNNVITGSWANGGNNVTPGSGNIWGLNSGQIPAYNNTGFQVIGSVGTVTANQVATTVAAGSTLTLPLGIPGQQITIKPIVALTGPVISASSNVCPLNSNTPGTTIVGSGKSFTQLIYDGTNWQVVSGA